jgi:hypothetical protein
MPKQDKNTTLPRISLFLPGVKTVIENKNTEVIKDKKKEKKEKNQVKIDTTQDIFELSDQEENTKINTKQVKLKEKDEQIKILNDKINELETKIYVLLNKSRRVINPSINMVDIITNKHIYNDENNVVNFRCMWDHHTFNTMPFFLPFKYIDGTYYVYGCFSSPECAMSYNNLILTDGDQNKKERNSLINRMVYEMTGKNEPVKPAPSPEIIDDYAYGYVSIDEYRNNLTLGFKEYIIYLPPMMPILPKIEEDHIDKLGLPIQSRESKFKLQRTKPLPQDKHNIITTMGISFTNNKN